MRAVRAAAAVELVRAARAAAAVELMAPTTLEPMPLPSPSSSYLRHRHVTDASSRDTRHGAYNGRVGIASGAECLGWGKTWQDRREASAI